MGNNNVMYGTLIRCRIENQTVATFLLSDELLQVPKQADVHLREAVVQVLRVLSELLDTSRLAVSRVRPPSAAEGRTADGTGNGKRQTGNERMRG